MLEAQGGDCLSKNEPGVPHSACCARSTREEKATSVKFSGIVSSARRRGGVKRYQEKCREEQRLIRASCSRRVIRFGFGKPAG